MTISLDANFGLVHKQHSGISSNSPSLKNKLFVPQDDVDDFVRQYKYDAKGESVNKIE